jgi:hypothetical protein
MKNAVQKIENKGSRNVFIQNAGNGVSIVAGLPWLEIVPAEARAQLAPRSSELDLLNPHLRAIELTGREQDMKSLWEWVHSNRPIAVRTLIGRAGAGKTRLA